MKVSGIKNKMYHPYFYWMDKNNWNIFTKYLIFLSTQERKSHRFKTTWGWI